MSRITRIQGWAVLTIGVLMIAAPLAMSLPGKASDGQKMIDAFAPIMRPATVAKTTTFYDRTFVPLRPVATSGAELASEAPKLVQTLSRQLHTTPAAVQQLLGSQFPAFGTLLSNLPQLTPVFANVPAGLDHYKPLVTTMGANVRNYERIASLPDFRWFTWFFVVPGVLLVAFGAWPLLAARRRNHPGAASAVGAAG